MSTFTASVVDCSEQQRCSRCTSVTMDRKFETIRVLTANEEHPTARLIDPHRRISAAVSAPGNGKGNEGAGKEDGEG